MGLHYTFMIPIRWNNHPHSVLLLSPHQRVRNNILLKPITKHYNRIQQILHIPWNTFLSVNYPAIKFNPLKTYRYETIFTHSDNLFFYCIYSCTFLKHSNYCRNEIMDFSMALCTSFPGGLWNGKNQFKKEEKYKLLQIQEVYKFIWLV